MIKALSFVLFFLVKYYIIYTLINLLFAQCNEIRTNDETQFYLGRIFKLDF